MCDAAFVAPTRRAAFEYINELVSDLARQIMSATASSTGTLAISSSLPDWFLAPREEALVAAQRLAHTQMLCSFVAERRRGE